MNALPQFVTEIGALPLIITHGWPGPVMELPKVAGPLTDPTALGGSTEDAFHLVLPSMLGYGFSGKPQSVVWGPDRAARDVDGASGAARIDGHSRRHAGDSAGRPSANGFAPQPTLVATEIRAAFRSFRRYDSGSTKPPDSRRQLLSNNGTEESSE